MTTQTHSERAMEAALAAMPGCEETSAALIIFLAAASHLSRTLGDVKAAELAYCVADDLVGGIAPL